MNAMKPFQNEIDDMTRAFVRIYYQKEFAEYQRLLVREQETFKEAYGENSKADDYANNPFPFPFWSAAGYRRHPGLPVCHELRDGGA